MACCAPGQLPPSYASGVTPTKLHAMVVLRCLIQPINLTRTTLTKIMLKILITLTTIGDKIIQRITPSAYQICTHKMQYDFERIKKTCHLQTKHTTVSE